MQIQRRFVIPAAGSATRFGGTPKELLPISKLRCGLTHAVELATEIGQCEPVVVTTEIKRPLHEAAIHAAGLRSQFVIDPSPVEMWGSVLQGIDRTMPGGLIMPDTVPILVDRLAASAVAPIAFGCFATSTPETFSCLDLRNVSRPRIRTKEEGADSLAWGIVVWDAIAANQLMEFRGHYDRAFEAVMRERGFGVFMLKCYSDLGTFDRYVEFINCR